MSAPVSLQPDPSAIGGISKAPLALLPAPTRLFAQRAQRFEVLAGASDLAPYLRFLAGLTRVQADVAAGLPAPEPIGAEQVERARANAMQPLDRKVMIGAPALGTVLDRLFAGAKAIAMPAPAADALERVASADAEARDFFVGNVLADAVPMESLAEHVFVAAGVQVHAAALAATLDAGRLVPVETGVCPVCGGPPVASVVVGFMGADGARYCACSLCGTLWNEVRVKCMACGSTKGIGYRAVETGDEEPTVKAEVCDECRSWLKILYQNRNPSLEAVADDVASLGLDILMNETDYRRGGFNAFLLGY